MHRAFHQLRRHPSAFPVNRQAMSRRLGLPWIQRYNVDIFCSIIFISLPRISTDVFSSFLPRADKPTHIRGSLTFFLKKKNLSLQKVFFSSLDNEEAACIWLEPMPLPLGIHRGSKMEWLRAAAFRITLSPVTNSYILGKNKVALSTQGRTLSPGQMPSSMLDLIKIERSC